MFVQGYTEIDTTSYLQKVVGLGFTFCESLYISVHTKV